MMRVLIGAFVGALLAGGAVYGWQSSEVDDVTDQLKEAQLSQSVAISIETQARTEIAELGTRLERVRRRLDRATAGRGTSAIAPSVVELDDGRYFGFIKSVQVDQIPPDFVVDLADFLTGAEAEEAAEAAGAVEEGDPVPNDYFIRNLNPLLRRVEMESSVQITLSTWSRHDIPNPRKVDLATFEGIFRTPKPREMNVVRNGYWITVEGGRVVELEEQYVP